MPLHRSMLAWREVGHLRSTNSTRCKCCEAHDAIKQEQDLSHKSIALLIPATQGWAAYRHFNSKTRWEMCYGCLILSCPCPPGTNANPKMKHEKREWKLQTCLRALGGQGTEQVQTDHMSHDQNILCTFSWELPCALEHSREPFAHERERALVGRILMSPALRVSHLVLIRPRDSPEQKMLSREGWQWGI